MLEKSKFAEHSLHQTFPLYGTYTILMYVLKFYPTIYVAIAILQKMLHYIYNIDNTVANQVSGHIIRYVSPLWDGSNEVKSQLHLYIGYP